MYEDTQEEIKVEVGDLVDVSSVPRFRCIVEEIEDDGSIIARPVASTRIWARFNPDWQGFDAV